MSSVHYKFSSSNSYATATFDGNAISLKDLKAIICEAKRFSLLDMDLSIQNAQTGEGTYLSLPLFSCNSRTLTSNSCTLTQCNCLTIAKMSKLAYTVPLMIRFHSRRIHKRR